MKNRYIVLGLVVLLFGAGSILFAQARRAHLGSGMGLGMWHGRGEQAFLDRLTMIFDLTEAQQSEIKQMWQAEKPNVLPLVQQLAQTHKQMVSASANGKFDQAAVTSLANKEAQIIAQLIVEKERITAKFYALLTPEQRAKFDRIQQRKLSRIEQFVQKLAAGTSN
ncbi:MAG TPA: Spy/CpxP family protein refolding chaperone [Terriglobales bacterium]|nr:Spy/CpxP family protein refolding chaperone [Terriglobales bacterium]